VTEPKIRAARDQDAAVLAELIAELGYPTDEAAVVQRLGGLRDAGDIVLVATVRDVPVALVTVHVTPVLHRPAPVGRLTAVVVSERVRGQGVGRTIVEAAERLLAERGCEMIELTSNRSRTDAHAFYEHLGYEATSLRFRKLIERA
jgi:GNAT superfamily N-acetyltransferase